MCVAPVQAQTALENKAAELDNARHTEEDLQQQHLQATQVGPEPVQSVCACLCS